MEQTKRTLHEVANIVEKTILEIKRADTINDTLITQTCEKYNTSEKHIRKVAGWNIGDNFYKK